jgi:hypothetical protein
LQCFINHLSDNLQKLHSSKVFAGSRGYKRSTVLLKKTQELKNKKKACVTECWRVFQRSMKDDSVDVAK